MRKRKPPRAGQGAAREVGEAEVGALEDPAAHVLAAQDLLLFVALGPVDLRCRRVAAFRLGRRRSEHQQEKRRETTYVSEFGHRV